jgi:hypothetical protein
MNQSDIRIAPSDRMTFSTERRASGHSSDESCQTADYSTIIVKGWSTEIYVKQPTEPDLANYQGRMTSGSITRIRTLFAQLPHSRQRPTRRSGEPSRADECNVWAASMRAGTWRSGLSTIYKGLVELTEYRSTGGTTRRRQLTSVAIGTLAVEKKLLGKEAERAQDRTAGQRLSEAVTTTTTVRRRTTEQEWPIMCWTNYSMQVGGYSSCYCLPLFTLY